MRKYLFLILGLSLVACSQKEENLKEETGVYQEADFATIRDFFYEKLFGETLVRTYGEDSGQTKVIFEKEGSFRGDYFGKIASDGMDYGLTWKAISSYGGEEIHTSTFEGKFEIIRQVDDYIYEMSLEDFKITSDEGPYDDIYFHVDFALGLNPEADYILYRPGCPIDKLYEDDRLRDIAQTGSKDGKKTIGFIIYNKTDGEVFSQNP